MAKLSTAAWAVHDVGLATAIGGTLFGRAALQPALHEIEDPEERDRVSAEAWQRFSWMNLAAHGAFAATWFAGRSMLSGREVSSTARLLTRVKDGLVMASLISGIASVVLGRVLGRRARRGDGAQKVRELAAPPTKRGRRTVALQRTVGGLGIVNLCSNVGIAGVTAVLAMEGSESLRFVPRSRRLP